MRADLNPDHWYLHRFRDTAATRWLRAGIDVRTVQSWLGHESLETTQKYLEPSKRHRTPACAYRLASVRRVVNDPFDEAFLPFPLPAGLGG